MAKIKLILSEALVDGMDVKFKAPCDCTDVDGLTVHYPTEDDERASMNFTFRDAHGKSLTGIGNLFARNAYVKAILNTTNKYAYLQNADNNSFLNDAIIGTYTHSSSGLTGSGVNGKFKATVSGTYSSIPVNGSDCTVKCGEDSSKELIAGCWYTFILDGSTINFNAGGAGAGLNVTVVNSSTEPASPKEDTIWVKGSYPAHTGWAISPIEPHRVSRSDNLIVYPYLNGTRTSNGVTFTVDDSSGNKGKITANGTNTSSSSIFFRLSDAGIENREMVLQPGTYRLCGNCESSSSSTHRLAIAYSYNNWSTKEFAYDDSGSGVDFTLTKIAKARVSIEVKGGKSADNALYQPVVVRAGVSTAYTMGNATGQLWIKTDSSSELRLNVLKQNEILVSPLEAYEYTTNSGWYKREMRVYQRGAWSELNTSLYIYNNGKSTGYSFACDTTMLQQSSGYPAQADRVNVKSTPITVTSNSRAYDFTNMFVTNSSDSFVKIDLSAYTKVRIKGTLSGASKATECVFRALSDMGDYATQNNIVSKSFTESTIDATVDISSVNSSCYLGFTFYNDSTSGKVIKFELTELWLE